MFVVGETTRVLDRVLTTLRVVRRPSSHGHWLVMAQEGEAVVVVRTVATEEEITPSCVRVGNVHVLVVPAEAPLDPLQSAR